MRNRTTKWATTPAVSAALALSPISPVNADAVPTTQVAKVATKVQAMAGTSGVVPASQTGHDADSAAIARVDGGTVDVPKDPSNDVTITTPTGEQIGIGIANGETAGDATTTVMTSSLARTPKASQQALRTSTHHGRRMRVRGRSPLATAWTGPCLRST